MSKEMQDSIQDTNNISGTELTTSKGVFQRVYEGIVASKKKSESGIVPDDLIVDTLGAGDVYYTERPTKWDIADSYTTNFTAPQFGESYDQYLLRRQRENLESASLKNRHTNPDKPLSIFDNILTKVFTNHKIEVVSVDSKSITVKIDNVVISKSVNELKDLNYSTSTIEDFIVTVLFCFAIKTEHKEITKPLYFICTNENKVKLKELEVVNKFEEVAILKSSENKTYIYTEIKIRNFSKHLSFTTFGQGHYFIFANYFDFISTVSSNITNWYSINDLTIKRIYDLYTEKESEDKKSR